MSFIYQITNDINNKIYIGKTNLTLQERFLEHCRDSKRVKNEKRPLHNAMNKYGIEYFKIEKIEECSAEEASNREQYWIEKLDSYVNGYNATKGGDGKLLYNHQEIANRLLNYPYPKEVAEEFKCSSDLVRIIAKEYNIKVYNRGQEINVNAKKEIYQYDKQNNYIQTFESTQKAAEWLLKNNYIKVLNSGVRSHIGEAANGKRCSAYSFIWKYKKVDEP